MRRLVTPQPGFSLGDFNDLLASEQFVSVNLYTITPAEGAIIRLCDAQEDVSVVGWNDVNRFTYQASDTVITGMKARSTIGVEVDEQEIEIAYPEDALFQNWRPWPEALLQGRLDNASISRDRAIAVDWDQPWVGVTRMFEGYDPEISSVGRSKAKLTVRSSLERLNIQMPRELYNPKCRNPFGGFRCGVDLASLAVIGSVGVGATRSIIPWASASASYAKGKIHISNGDSVTRVRTIQRADAGHLYLTYPLDFDPEAALDFTAWPGCTRTTDQAPGCQTYHPTDWQDHFGGCPFTPVAETAF